MKDLIFKGSAMLFSVHKKTPFKPFHEASYILASLSFFGNDVAANKLWDTI